MSGITIVIEEAVAGAVATSHFVLPRANIYNTVELTKGLPIHLPEWLPTCLPSLLTQLPTWLYNNLPTYIPTDLPA